MKHTHWLFVIEGIGVIFTGILLGTILGPIDQWSDLYTTMYGRKFIAAFFFSCFRITLGFFDWVPKNNECIRR